MFQVKRCRGLVAVLVAAALVGSAAGQQKDLLKSSPKVHAAFKEVVEGPSKSVVRIECDGKEAALGTIVAADGYILTKASEIKGTAIVCKIGDKKHDATIVGVEDKHDLMMLKIDVKDLTPVKFVESKGTAVGFWVASVGTTNEPVAVGVLSVASRNPGRGEMRPTVNQGGGFLGIQLSDEEVEGAKIGEVTPGSPAEKGGLKKDDIVTMVEKKAIKSSADLIATISSYKPNDEVTLKVKREDKDMSIKVTLGKRPNQGMDRGDLQNSMGSVLSNKRTGFPTILQHDSVVRPQDCGGPLVNLEGHVIGINIARAGRVESWAIPAETIQPLLADLKSGKLAPQGVKPVVSPAVTAAKAALEAAMKEETEAQKKLDTAKEARKKAEEALKKAEEESKK